MKHKIRIKQGRVMNGWFRFVFTVFSICSSFVLIVRMNTLFGFLIIALIAFLLLMVWTSFYLLEIDTERNTYGDYTVVLGKKIGKEQSYPEIEDIFIKEFNTSTTYQNYNTGMVRSLKGKEFQSYLKFSNGKKVELLSDEELSRLVKRLEPVARKLQTSIRQS